ncbi:hypothetical protein ONE63_000657 [Megalurothrips usitatus]|uniref:Uncharacterized protein n=1 Tax=Megalurothrips usitatus TaxID=439358 RepID=A0AAV7Y286_9NEOP|nr:hypothetical protein ONE63_000657 [Megalurothrips usitatus]
MCQCVPDRRRSRLDARHADVCAAGTAGPVPRPRRRGRPRPRPRPPTGAGLQRPRPLLVAVGGAHRGRAQRRGQRRRPPRLRQPRTGECGPNLTVPPRAPSAPEVPGDGRQRRCFSDPRLPTLAAAPMTCE